MHIFNNISSDLVDIRWPALGVKNPILTENNLGQINYWAFALKAGSTPAKAPAAKQDDTIYRQEIRVVNHYEELAEFLVVVEGLEADWNVLPAPQMEVPPLAPGEETTIEFDVVKHNTAHRDSAEVAFRLYKLPDMELAGAIHTDLAIDDLPPLPVGGWKAEIHKPFVDNLVRPEPSGKLSWDEPEWDVGGFPERIRFFEIYAAPDPAAAMALDPAFLLEQTYSDVDPDTPGFQVYVYEPLEPPLFYTVVPVDMADGRGEPAPAMELQLPVASVPGAADGSALSQNYPNPFNPQTTIDFTLTRGERVRVSVHDAAGRLVKELTNELYGPGIWSVTWNGKDDGGKDVSSGVYFLKLKSASLEDAKKMTLVR